MIFGKPLQSLGWKNNPISAINDYYQEIKDGKNEDLAVAIEKTGKGKTAEYAATLMSGLISAVPNVVMAYMTSGMSAGAQLGTTATSYAGNVLKNPLFWYSFETNLYPEYEYALQNGATENEAILIAPFAALINAKIEVGGGIETLPDVMKKPETRNGIFKQWAKIAVSEGNEEIAQSIVTEALQKLTFDSGKKWISLDGGENAVFNIPGLAKDWTMGTAIGGILGAPGMLGVRGNKSTPISAKPFNTYQFQTADIKNQPISANAFQAMGQRNSINNVLNEKNGLVDKIDSKNYNYATITERLSKGEISATILVGRQKKHIEGTKEYFDKYKDGSNPQGVLTISTDEAQKLVNKYAGKGIPGKKDKSGEWTEFVNADFTVGKCFIKGQYCDTNRFAIHYGEKGAHIMPVQPLEEMKK